MSTVNPHDAKTNLSRLVERAAAGEISIKAALGRLTVPLDRFEEMAVRMGFEIPPILPAHAIAAGQLPLPHADPFDRMRIARARVEGLVLVSDDRKVAGYDVRVLG